MSPSSPAAASQAPTDKEKSAEIPALFLLLYFRFKGQI
ncbi:hypothetical protein B4144_2768 [Bacillus atrophaeus]|nr:hypothetical protein B4144_2768 [Bacillus atrophaeus]